MKSTIDSPTFRTVRWVGHSHIYRTSPVARPIEQDCKMLRDLGLNYFGFGHPWQPWDLELIRKWEKDDASKRLYHDEKIWRQTDPASWTRPERFKEWREKYTTDDFIFEIDCETPKIRFGHLWWLGWQPEHAPWHDYDTFWTAWEVGGERRMGHAPPPFTMRIHARVIRAQVAMGALPVYAHPTSWWWQDGQHITNIASTLVPDILTGQAAGCLVVMGYEADHKHYQELWFNLLNKGYFMTGVAECDACLDHVAFERAVFQNHTPVADFSTKGIQKALVAGHNVMTTGPELNISCGACGPGDTSPEEGGLVKISCGALDPAQTYKLNLIRNGKPVAEWTVAGSASFHSEFPNDRGGWVLARLVNQSKPYDAALTNPIFFKNEPVRVTGHPLPETEIAWWDRPGGLDRAYYLAKGDWLGDFPGHNPGEVPWEAFRWDDWVEFLAGPGT